MDKMTSNTILVINAITYSITFIYFFLKNKKINIGLSLLLLTVICSWSSVALYNNPLFPNTVHYSKMTIEPFVFLYVCLMMYFRPYLNNQENDVIILPPSKKKKDFVISLMIIILLISILILLPQSNLNDLGDTRAMLSSSGIKLWFSSNWFLSKLFLLTTSIIPFIIIFSFYSAFVEHTKKGILLFILLCVFLAIYGISFAERGHLMVSIIYIGFLFIFFRKTISKKMRRYFYVSSMIIVVAFVSFFILVSNSRFKEDAGFFYIKYAGENFINFDGLLYDNLKNTTDGSTYFRFLKGDSEFKNPEDKWDYTERITGVRGQYFYTMVGALMFDFGKVGTFIIAMIFCIAMTSFVRKRKYLSFSDMLVYLIGLYVVVYGVFFFEFQGTSGNLTLLFIIVFSLYFKTPVNNVTSLKNNSNENRNTDISQGT
jgi:oligosaccharide repeat unit polymerase